MYKSTEIHVRISQEDKNKIRKKAKELNMTMSQYVRKCCLGLEEPEDIFKLKVVTTALRELSDYLKENYGEDEFIRNSMKKILDILS